MKTLYFKILLFVVLLPSLVLAQLNTSTALTPQQLVQDVLLGTGVTASNITFTGANNSSFKAIGSFNVVGTNNLGINAGVVLTTGTVTGANGPAGPNNSGGAGVDNGEPGNAYLTSVAGVSTENAAILEFDFVPQSDSIKFKYVFGTDEYMEYVSGGYADVFAFVLSGVTVAMPAHNIALIPGTSTPVTAINVNANLNSQYYVDNENPAGPVCEYDGFTRVLTAKEAVQCGQTYHIKLMVGDAIDGILDAGVFLEAGSFSSSSPFDINTVGNSVGPIGSANSLYENCGSLNLIFTRPTASSTNADTLALGIGGTASSADYTGLNDTIFFPAGEDTVFVPIFAIDESVVDTGETVHIYYTYTNPCNVVDTIDYTFTILESPSLSLTVTNDTAICSNQSVTLIAQPTGGVPAYLQVWADSLGNVVSSSASYVPPAIVKTYYYYVTDACRQDTLFDSVHVDVNTFLYLSGTLDVLGSNNDSLIVEGCGDALLTFTENGMGAGVGVHTYNINITGTVGSNSPADIGITIPSTITFNNQTSVQFNLTAIADGIAENGYAPGYEVVIITIDYAGNPCIPIGGKLVKKLYIKDPTPFSVNLTNDTSICKGRNLQLKAITTGGGGTISYAWQHTANTNSTVLVFPPVSTTYYVTAKESCNDSIATDSVRVTVVFDPPRVSVVELDSICIRENYTFVTTQTHGIGNVVGNWLQSENMNSIVSNGSTNSWIINNVATTETYVYSVKDQCNFVDTDTITVLAIDCDLVVPNIVTSNGDNINDVFFIKNLHKNPGTSVKIYDRWGVKMYESADYQNNWKPNELSDGVYYYIVESVKRGKFNGFLHVLNNK